MGDIDGAAAEEGDRETSRGTNGLLAGGNDTVQAPFVESEFLTRHTADTVGNDERVGRDLLDRLDERLEVKEDTGRGVDVGGGNQLVLLLGEGLLNLGSRRNAADGTVELGHLGAVGAEAVGEAVTKVAAAENEDILAGLDEVGGDEIPAEGTRTVDDVWLSLGVGRADDLAEEREGLTKDLDEASTDVALTVVEKTRLLESLQF